MKRRYISKDVVCVRVRERVSVFFNFKGNERFCRGKIIYITQSSFFLGGEINEIKYCQIYPKLITKSVKFLVCS